MSTETTNPGRQVCGECMNGVYEYGATCDHAPYLDQTVTCKHCGQWLPCQCSAPNTFALNLTQRELETLEEALRRYIGHIKRDFNYDHTSSAWRGHLLEAERIRNYASSTILAAKERGEIR